MKEWPKFEWAVLALTVAILLLMGGWFVAGNIRAANAWRVEVERSDSPEPSFSVSQEGRPDSLLEGEAIDLNAATAADLERLPGIGQSRAQAIVDHRQENGLFESVDDLARVDGIGPGILEQLRPYVTVG